MSVAESKTVVQADVKIESGVTIVGQDGVTDIQNYLETFNKEIQGGDQVVQQVGVVAEEAPSEEGTYYVDQAGQYYYQSPACEGQQVMTVVSGIADPNAEVDGTEGYVSIPQDAQQLSTAEANEEAGEENQMILGTGDAYQTVTIVPSETNPGEVSYVLIVQQQGDEEKDKEDGEDHDLTVYDFDDGEEPGVVSGAESGDEDDKSKIVKFFPKKSQTVTQAHMCNYCNYTSPKRYLLSRHMKSHSEERPHKCSVCERGFKTLASLQNHVNTHTGTKPHRCKFCESAFTTSGELVRHVRYKHTHEKPHKCTICDYASVELSKMRNHMRCHTGERPYQVDSVLESTRIKSILMAYFTKKDSNTSTCLLCKSDFETEGIEALINHLIIVHRVKASENSPPKTVLPAGDRRRSKAATGEIDIAAMETDSFIYFNGSEGIEAYDEGVNVVDCMSIEMKHPVIEEIVETSTGVIEPSNAIVTQVQSGNDNFKANLRTTPAEDIPIKSSESLFSVKATDSSLVSDCQLSSTELIQFSNTSDIEVIKSRSDKPSSNKVVVERIELEPTFRDVGSVFKASLDKLGVSYSSDTPSNVELSWSDDLCRDNGVGTRDCPKNTTVVEDNVVHAGLTVDPSESTANTCDDIASSVWQYFVRQGENAFMCNMCKVRLKYCGSTENLLSHILSVHHNLLEGKMLQSKEYSERSEDTDKKHNKKSKSPNKVSRGRRIVITPLSNVTDFEKNLIPETTSLCTTRKEKLVDVQKKKYSSSQSNSRRKLVSKANGCNNSSSKNSPDIVTKPTSHDENLKVFRSLGADRTGERTELSKRTESVLLKSRRSSRIRGRQIRITPKFDFNLDASATLVDNESVPESLNKITNYDAINLTSETTEKDNNTMERKRFKEHQIKSFVFGYFTKRNKKSLTCSLCSAKLYNLSTKSLILHLRNKHPNVLSEFDIDHYVMDILKFSERNSIVKQYFKQNEKSPALSTCLMCLSSHKCSILVLFKHLKTQHPDELSESCRRLIKNSCSENYTDVEFECNTKESREQFCPSIKKNFTLTLSKKEEHDEKESNTCAVPNVILIGKPSNPTSDFENDMTNSVTETIEIASLLSSSQNSKPEESGEGQPVSRKFSFVWRYFIKKDKTISTCLLCKRDFKNSCSTGILMHHLKKAHMDVKLDTTCTGASRSEVRNFFTEKDKRTATCSLCNVVLEHLGKVYPLKQHLKKMHPDQLAEDSSLRTKKVKKYRSKVWEYFTRIDSNKSACSLCHSVFLNSNSTGILRDHLRRRHQVSLLCDRIRKTPNTTETQPAQKEKGIEDGRSCIKIQVLHNQQTRNNSRKRSLLWQYFTKNGKTAFCSICELKIKYLGKISILRTHLRTRHSIILHTENLIPEANITSENKKVRKNRSIVWDYFTKKENGFVMCFLCLRNFRNNGTTGCLMDHLRTKHPVVLGTSIAYENDEIAVNVASEQSDGTHLTAPTTPSDAVPVNVVFPNDISTTANETLSAPTHETAVHTISLPNERTFIDTTAFRHNSMPTTGKVIYVPVRDETAMSTISIPNDGTVVNNSPISSDQTHFNIITVPSDSTPANTISVCSGEMHTNVITIPYDEAPIGSIPSDVSNFITSDTDPTNTEHIENDLIRGFVTCPETPVIASGATSVNAVTRHESAMNKITVHDETTPMYTISVPSVGSCDNSRVVPSCRVQRTCHIDSEPQEDETTELCVRKCSFVWKYFTKKNYTTSTCSICSKELKNYGSTRNLMEHLKRIHPTVQIPHALRINLEKKYSSNTKRLAKNKLLIWGFFIKRNRITATCLMCEQDITSPKNLVKSLEDHLQSYHQVDLSENMVKERVRKNRSVVWTYFSKKDERTSTCSLCHVDFSHACTTNLMDHLDKKHPDMLYEYNFPNQIEEPLPNTIEISYLDGASPIDTAVTLPLTIGAIGNSPTTQNESFTKDLPLMGNTSEEILLTAENEIEIATTDSVVLPIEHSVVGKELPFADEILHSDQGNKQTLSPCLLNVGHKLEYKSKKRRSLVWKYFTMKDERTSTCSMCGVAIKNHKKIRILIDHLKVEHNITIAYNLKKISMKRRSLVWQYFNRRNEKTSTCSLCSHNLNHSSTRNLMSHLKSQHPSAVGLSPSNPNQGPNKCSSVWRYFIRNDSKTAVCILCCHNFNYYRNTTVLLEHVRKVHEIQIKRTPRKCNRVWEYFTKEGKGATCSLCQYYFTNSNWTTNFISHLRTRHKIVLSNGNSDVECNVNAALDKEDTGSADAGPSVSDVDPSLTSATDVNSDNKPDDNILTKEHSTNALTKPLAQSLADIVKNSKIRSNVWQYFIKKDNRTSECLQCNTNVKHEGTGNLCFHLRKYHPGILPESLLAKKLPIKKGTSVVWQYFVKKNKMTANCSLCQRDFKTHGTTSSLLFHLKKSHSLTPTAISQASNIDKGKRSDCLSSSGDVPVDSIIPGGLERNESNVLQNDSLKNNRQHSIKNGKKSSKTSIVWKYFTRKDDTKTSCRLCKKEFKVEFWSTGSMLYHLKSKHESTLNADETG